MTYKPVDIAGATNHRPGDEALEGTVDVLANDFTFEAVSFWKAFDADLMPDAMALAAKVARKLVNKIEAYRNA